jgi:hypothetical protein
MNAALLVGAFIVLALLMFLVISEAMRSDSAPEQRGWEMSTSRLPEHVLHQLLSMDVKLYPHSLGFRQCHVPFTYDLQDFSDFILQKLFKYTRVQSVALTHMYRVTGTFNSRPTFRLVPPSYNLSLVLVILSEHAVVTHANKTTKVASGMLAFTPFRRHNDCPILIECNDFCYGYISTISTLDHC